MSNISIIPNNGTRISVGGVLGENTSATNNLQKELDAKGYPRKSSNFGAGGALTFSQDIISANIGKKEKGLEFRSGAEISVGTQTVQKSTKTGEEQAWRVDVVSDTWVRDPNTGEGHVQTQVYTRTFSSKEEAEMYWRRANLGYDPGASYATPPREVTIDIMDKTSKTEASLRVGATAGIQKNFEYSSVRVDALTGYDILQKSAYAGGRVTYSTYNYGSRTIGVYAQVDTDISGKEKDTRGQVGLTFGFK